MEDITWIVAMICFTLITITILIVSAWVNTPTNFTIGMNMNDQTLEAFKLAYNCSGGYL